MSRQVTPLLLTSALAAALSLATETASAQSLGLSQISSPLLCPSVTDCDAFLADLDRRRPGHEPPEQRESPEIDPTRVEPVPYDVSGAFFTPISDRWRLMEAVGRTEKWYDPYNFNLYKADRPLHDDWFLNVLAISDTILEPRSVPTPVGPQTTTNPGSLDIFGGDDQIIAATTAILGVVYYKGNTVFRPPDWEYRLTLAFNYNYLTTDETRFPRIDPRTGKSRHDSFVGVQELFVDKHLRNVSDRYDFDSIRIGIQPFSTDFRGFLFQDNQFGVRLFGNRDNNLYQYNLAWFRRIEKDTNSGLNDVGAGLRDDDIFVANLYRQDWPKLGFFSQVTMVYNRNREGDEFFFDENGFIQRPSSLGVERPRDYDVYYIGYNGDGHIGRLNLTVSAYYAFGDNEPSIFSGENTDINAGFIAAEAGFDLDWTRIRVTGIWGSGDDDPYDDESNGFDAIFENPIIAGSDTSYWIRQNVPFIGGGGVALSGRNSVLNSLRPSKELGQSNFDNPGVRLLGLGADFDLYPELRVSTNINGIWFDDTAVVEAARNQGDIDKFIGVDASISAIWRPYMSQNVIVRLSAAALFPGDGFKQLYEDDTQYSVLANVIFAY